jgi:hypothetical protein
MTKQEAEIAIRAILEAVDTRELPKPRIKNNRDGTSTAWFGGLGQVLGTAKRGDERRPKNYQDNAIREAFQGEALYRIDKKRLKTETSL